MINTRLNEINRDYYDSVRKSILDYVLKDDSERLRIGIMQTFDEVIDYGEIFIGVLNSTSNGENMSILPEIKFHKILLFIVKQL